MSGDARRQEGESALYPEMLDGKRENLRCIRRCWTARESICLVSEDAGQQGDCSILHLEMLDGRLAVLRWISRCWKARQSCRLASGNASRTVGHAGLHLQILAWASRRLSNRPRKCHFSCSLAGEGQHLLLQVQEFQGKRRRRGFQQVQNFFCRFYVTYA